MTLDVVTLFTFEYPGKCKYSMLIDRNHLITVTIHMRSYSYQNTKSIQTSGKAGKLQNHNHTPDLDQQNALCKIAAKQCLLSLMNISNLDT